MSDYIMDLEDVIRMKDLEIRRIKEERDAAQERVTRLLAALDLATREHTFPGACGAPDGNNH